MTPIIPCLITLVYLGSFYPKNSGHCLTYASCDIDSPYPLWLHYLIEDGIYQLLRIPLFTVNKVDFISYTLWYRESFYHIEVCTPYPFPINRVVSYLNSLLCGTMNPPIEQLADIILFPLHIVRIYYNFLHHVTPTTNIIYRTQVLPSKHQGHHESPCLKRADLIPFPVHRV